MKARSFKSALASLLAAATAMGSMSVLGGTAPSVSAADDNYAKLLQYSLYFYDINMCGTNSDCAISWRGACHTGDEVVGGYHDAGDHAMFGLPQGYTASTLGWAFYEFKDAFNATGQATHLKVVSKHFTDFFKKSTKLSGDTVTNLLYQKGNGDIDHDYWGAPENQERMQGDRQMYWSSNGASDIAAEYAAALALDYINFGDTESLKYAEALYAFSTKYNQVATEGLQGKNGWFYKNSSCQDEQAWAAGWLYIATKKENYKSDLAAKQVQYLGWVHGWETVATGAAILQAEITGDWSKVTGWMGQYTNGSGYFMLNGGEWGSARINCSMQMTALIATKHKAADYTNWVKGQMDYILGNNPANTCFVCGYASNSAKNPHHRAASGYNGYAELGNNKTYGANGKVCTGALVGGPGDKNGTYSDVIDDYQCNEVAIDYNAGLVGAAAGLYSLSPKGTIDTSVPGATKIYNGTVGDDDPIDTTPIVTTTTQSTPQGSTSDGAVYTLNVGKSYNYNDLKSKDATMIGFKYEDFGLKAGSTEKIQKVEVNISANSKIGTYQGAFGTSTSVAPDYWAQDDDQGAVFSGNSGTITWKTPSDIANIIQYGYGGELKVGFWWIDNPDFTIDSIKIYTDAKSSVVTQPSSTTSTSTTTKTTTTTTQTTPQQNNSGVYTLNVGKSYNYNDLKSKDALMIGFKYEDFGIAPDCQDKVTKVEVNISANGKIGTWQGAFGTSTDTPPEYWSQDKDMEAVFSGNTGTITWNTPSDIAKNIQYGYDGEVKVGFWWIDNPDFTIDSVKIYTDAKSSVVTTTTSTTTTTTTTTTTPQSQKVTLRGDANCDGKVTVSDAIILARTAAEDNAGITEQGLLNGDVDGVYGISSNDVILILKHVAGIQSL